jgi:Ras-related protein Rab-1A
MNQMNYEHVFKVLLIGDSGVGKTSILNRFIDDKFNETFVSTIGVDFKAKSIALEGKITKLQIWDTAGQERFKTITSSYYRGSHGVVIIFDVTNRKSFENIKMWLNEIRLHCDNGTKKILVGSKTDLEDKIEVSCSEALSFANRHNMKYVETSAKESKNIELAFINLANEIKSRMRETTTFFMDGNPMENSIRLSEFPVGKHKNQECCFQ